MILRLLSALLLLPASADASAWTRAAGEGFVAQTVAFITADKAFDRAGDPRPGGGFESWELRTYAEYGLRDGLTALGQITLIRKSVDGPPADTRTGLDHAEAGLRARLGRWGNTVASAQGSVRLPGAWGDDAPAAAGSADPEIDARLLAGHGWGATEHGGWADVQAGFRRRFGPPPDEARLDLTFGVRPRPGLSLIAQSFNTLALSGDAASAKLQASAVVAVTPIWSVQIGAGFTPFGRDTAQETTGFLAVWRPF